MDISAATLDLLVAMRDAAIETLKKAPAVSEALLQVPLRRHEQAIEFITSAPPEERLRNELAFWMVVSADDVTSAEEDSDAEVAQEFLSAYERIQRALDTEGFDTAFAVMAELTDVIPLPETFVVPGPYWADVLSRR
jgi:hypothetical protein